MPFGYRFRRSEAAPHGGRGTPILLACDLSEKASGGRAMKIARQLQEESARDVVLLSEAKALPGLEKRLEPSAVSPLVLFEAMVAVRPGEAARLSPRMISLLSNLRIDGVRRINPRGKTSPYRRLRREGARRALFIFPGLFTPPRIGSHQRAFSTVLDLIEDGFDVDIVVKRREGRLFERSKPYLALLTETLSTYSVAAPEAEQVAAPPTFADRQATDFDDDARALVASLTAKTQYSLVVVSFPWMLGVLDGAERGGARIVCDTHDVVSNRWKELAGGDPEAKTLAGAERDLLKRCDAVLAISKSDARLFETELGLGNVVIHPITYHPAEEAVVQWRSAAGPLSFGFVGSDMEANRRALKFIMSQWWPVIEEFSPDSRLTIAGAIANSPAVSPYWMLRENVSTAGFVEDLGAFFDSVDVLLSPAVVQGGVNVKNIEALLRRRPVITNTVGARSLDPIPTPTRCDTGKGLLDVLRKIDRRDPGLMAALDASFDEAARLHAKPKRLSWT